MPRVSYHGAPGAYSSLAAKELLRDCQPVACDTMDLVTDSVTQWRSDLAIVPIQNTLEGTLHEIQDKLISCGLHIVGEVNIPVIHCLAALPSTQRKDIKRILSHSMVSPPLARLASQSIRTLSTLSSLALVGLRLWRSARRT